MKKRNFIVCMMLLISMIYPNFVSAQDTITEAFPIYNYHENSANNGTGDFRQIQATSFIGNVTHYMALAAGRETIPITWPAYDGDILSLSPSLINTRGFTNGEELIKYEFLVYLSPNLKIDFSKEVQLKVGDAQILTIAWSDLNYSYDQEKGLLSYEIPVNFKSVITSKTKGQIGIQFQATFKSSAVGKQKELIPINLKTITTTNKAQYISGATNNYQIDLPSEAKKEVVNLEEDQTENEYHPGDRIKYSISYLNNMYVSQTKIANLQLEDKIPEGFLLDASTLKIMLTNSNGVTEDMTSSGNVEVISTDGTMKILIHHLDPANKVTISYEGVIDSNTSLEHIKNIANFTGDDTSIDQKINSSAEVDIDVIKQNAAPVTVRYEDETGNELAPPDILQGALGASYQSAAKSINGWTIKTNPENITGVFTKVPQEVIYVYQKAIPVTASVTIKYLDEGGNELMPSEILTGQLGATYQTAAKDIAGWSLKATPNNQTGIFTNVSQEVIYIYQKEQQQIVNPPTVERDGNISPSHNNQKKSKLVDKLPTTGETTEESVLIGMSLLLLSIMLFIRNYHFDKSIG